MEAVIKIPSIIADNLELFIFASICALFLKGLAVWKAAQLSHRWWFIILFLVNDIGILEVIYLYFVARKYSVEVESENA